MKNKKQKNKRTTNMENPYKKQKEQKTDTT